MLGRVYVRVPSTVVALRVTVWPATNPRTGTVSALEAATCLRKTSVPPVVT